MATLISSSSSSVPRPDCRSTTTVISQRSRAAAAEDDDGSVPAIPVVDMSKKREEVAEAMVKASEKYGFFKIVNHGVLREVISAMEEEAKKLFALPLHEKEKGGPTDPYGYGNRNIGRNGDLGWIEYLLLRCHPQDVQQRYMAISPDDYVNFCNTVNKYIASTRKLACDVLVLLAEGIGLPRDSFSRFLMDEKSDSAFRVNHYPSCPEPSSNIGFGEHCDPQILTVLHSNDVGGLQVLLPDGKWVTVSPDPFSFSINIGDCLQVLTNGRFKSVRHRVVVNKHRSRISMMFFGAPALEAVIECPSQLGNEDHPMVYRSFSWGEYKRSIYASRLGNGPLQRFLVRPTSP